jgi:hypothetical protein
MAIARLGQDGTPGLGTGRRRRDDRPGSTASPTDRLGHYTKGICIIMVVMMHSTLGVEAAAGARG